MAAYAKLQAGVEGGPADYYPVRAQFEEFRGERRRALGAVLEAERNLRGILGLPIEDGCRLVPITPPTLAPFRPDWCTSLQDALTLRPELVLARDNLRQAQLNLIAAQNFLKPDIRFTSTYSPVGFGTTLAGNGTLVDGTGTVRSNNAFDQLSSMHFNDWSLGFVANIPIGFRFEHAAVRQAHLGLAQAHHLLKDQESRAARALTAQYQKLQEWYGLIQDRQAERISYAEAVNVLLKQVIEGARPPGDLALLDFQRRLASAQVKEYEAIAEYNNTIARLEWSKGTILQHTNVIIGEGPLPECAQVRAVEHERERSESLVLKLRPGPLTHPGRLVGKVAELPPLPPNGAPGDETLQMPRTLTPQDNGAQPDPQDTPRTSPPLNGPGDFTPPSQTTPLTPEHTGNITQTSAIVEPNKFPLHTSMPSNPLSDDLPPAPGNR
jgi:hypothetical protein